MQHFKFPHNFLLVAILVLVPHWAMASHKNALGFTPQEQLWLDAHPQIRIGIMNAWPPMDYIDSNDMPQGIGTEFIRAINKRLGDRLQIVPGSWKPTYEAVKEKRLDALMDITPRPDREVFFHFTRPYIDVPHLIFTRKEEPYKATLADLKNMTVGVERGFFIVNVLQKDYPEVKVIEFNSTSDALDALTKGEVDAYIGNRAVAMYIIENELITNVKPQGKIRETSSINAIGVRKDWSILRDILQKVLNDISAQERSDIVNRSTQRQTRPDIGLTSEEKAWVNEHPVIRVHNEMNWPPFNFNRNDKPAGYSVDYINKVSDIIDIEVEYVSNLNRNELMHMLRTGSLDVMMNIVSTRNGRRYFEYTKPYIDAASGIYVHKYFKEDIRSLNDLAGKRVAVPMGFYYEELLSRYYPDIKLVLLEDSQKCLEAVAFGQADATIGEISSHGYLLDKSFITNMKLAAQIQDQRFSPSMGIAVNKGQHILRNILQKGMDAITPEENQALRRKWALVVKGADRAGFSEQHDNFLASIDEIRMCVYPGRMPLAELDKNGRYIGIGAKVMDRVREKLPVPLRLIKTRDHMETLEFVRTRKCDMIDLTMPSRKQEKYLAYSEPYLHLPLVIATTTGKHFIADMQELNDREIGITRDCAVRGKLRKYYPNIRFTEVQSTRDGLEKVSAGQLYGFIDTLAVIAYTIEEHGILDIKISGKLDEHLDLSVGVRNDWPQLAAIVDKIMAEIGNKTIQDIYQQQVAVKMVEEFDYTVLLKYLFIVVLVVAFILYRNYQLNKFNKELTRIAVTDQLTGIYNRKHLDEMLEIEVERSVRYKHPFSVIMTDIDKFKEVNDSCGHHVGDEVLKKVVSVLGNRVRGSDTLGRWGGEEFMLLCPETGLDSATQLAEQLRQAVEEEGFPKVGNKTASFGVATYHAGEKGVDVVKRADKALFAAKKSGRNRVVASEDENGTA